MKNNVLKIFTIVFFAILQLISFAESKPSEAVFVETFFDKIIKIAKDSNIDKNAKEKKCIDITSDVLDFDWNAKMALGANFKQFNSDEKQEYLNAYKDLLMSKWLPKIYNVDKLVDIKIDNNVVKLSDTDSLVRVQFLYKDDAKKINSVNADIRIRNFPDNTQKILNVIVENVDLALSYRSDFTSVIEKKGLQAFLKDLKAKSLNK